MKKFTVAVSFSAILHGGCMSNEPQTLTDAELPDIELEEVCGKYAKRCEKLKADSRCRTERSKALIGHYYYHESPTPEKAYRQILRLEDLLSCTELSKLIEYVPVNKKYPDPESEMTDDKIKEKRRYARSVAQRKEDKAQNYEFAKHMLEGLVNANRESGNPYMLYYLWSKEHEEEAFDQLEAMYDSGKIHQYDVKYFIAQGVAKFDEEKAVKLIFESLESYPTNLYTEKTDLEAKEIGELRISDRGRVHFSIFRHLTDMYYQKGDYARSYIFAILLKENNDMTANAEMILREFDDKHFDVGRLEDIADEIDEMLSEGHFDHRILNKV